MGHLGQHLTRKRGKNVDQVPHTTKLAVTDYFVSGYFMRFQSRESIFNQILEALQDENTHIVGLFGMGGTGKTTLAKEVGKRAKELNIFNQVLVVAVTETPNVKKIHDEIVEGLGLKLGEETLVARQRQISLRLRNEERILIILDDIWKKLDLQQIGIPYDYGGIPMGCKVLLTTQSKQVGYMMRCQQIFHLYLLSNEDAWSYFRKCAGIDDVSPELIVEAHEVAKHCQGLPVAIAVMGASLRGKTVDQWKLALKTLRSPKGMGLDWKDDSSNFIYRVVQLSYNGLNSKVTKFLFLMCGLFPEDQEILIKDLSQYVIKLGLCGKNDYTIAVNQVHGAVNDLIYSGLLMHANTSKDHVIMHHLVRDMAHRIVQEENRDYDDSIEEYLAALKKHDTPQDCIKNFQWHEELGRLLCLLYQVRKSPSSSTSNAVTREGPDLSVVVRSLTHTHDVTIPKPSGKLVDFYGLCQVDKSFLPLLKKACEREPQLIESQRRHSEMLRQCAFDCLGRLLFLLHNVRNKNWVYHKHELQIYWEQIKVMKFDLEWLSPVVEGVLSSADIARIGALHVEEKYWKEEAAKLREQLRLVEDKAAVVNKEIALIESKLDGFAFTDDSNAQIVSNVSSPWRKFFFRK